jgi:DNA-binding IclR family transcriptional regulator
MINVNPMEQQPAAGMIERVSMILDVFSPEEPVLTGGEIARRAGLSRATTARILSELARHDFIDRVQSGYQIGIRCFELGQMAQQPKDLRRLALATMFDLRRATGLTVQLGVLEGNDVVYIEILRGQYRDLTIPSRVGGRVPSYATAGGKALLAHSPDRLVEELLDGRLEKIGPNTVTDPRELRAELDLARREGIAYEREESQAGLACAASPILRGDGTAAAAISITAPVGVVEMRLVGPAGHAATLGLNRQVAAAPHWAKL